MRVLWLTIMPLPAVEEHAGCSIQGGGSWMPSLLEQLRREPEIQCGVLTAYPGLRDADFRVNGVDYMVIGQSQSAQRLDYIAGDLERCAAVIHRWKPDLVHIHGTERFYGLLWARGLLTIPAVVSLQGIITACAKWRNYFGDLSLPGIVRQHGLAGIRLSAGLLRGYHALRRRVPQEQEIIRSLGAFLGRTQWDEAQLRLLHPAAYYHHVDELMRPEFIAARWSLESCRRHSLIFTNAGHPRRGTPELLQAVALLRSEFPDIRLGIGGRLNPETGYGRIVAGQVKRLGLNGCVTFFGYMDAGNMARELARSHVFVISSYIENSPNSLCEAMLTGMPCVASCVGGIPSLLANGEDGLIFPAGDAPALARRLGQIFRDDALATHLGSSARQRALARHDPKRVLHQLLEAYFTVAGTPKLKPRPGNGGTIPETAGPVVSH